MIFTINSGYICEQFSPIQLTGFIFAVCSKKFLKLITFYCALLFKDSMYMNLTIINTPSALHRIVELVVLLAYD